IKIPGYGKSDAVSLTGDKTKLDAALVEIYANDEATPIATFIGTKEKWQDETRNLGAGTKLTVKVYDDPEGKNEIEDAKVVWSLVGSNETACGINNSTLRADNAITLPSSDNENERFVVSTEKSYQIP